MPSGLREEALVVVNLFNRNRRVSHYVGVAIILLPSSFLLSLSARQKKECGLLIRTLS